MNVLLPQPTSAECRALRESLQLTAEQMAAVAGLKHRQRWAEYESEKEPALPDRYRWTILMLMLDLHPTLQLAPRQEAVPLDLPLLAEAVAQARQARSAATT
jgi:transcriptional regulator with XRE-family HTH domain